MSQLTLEPIRLGLHHASRLARRHSAGFCVALGLIAAFHGGALFSPPYWDYLDALWMEAVYLFRSGFDYAALARESPQYTGGSLAYLLTIVPGAIAALFHFSPSPASTVVILHVLTWCLAAAMLRSFYLACEASCGRLHAWLTTLALGLGPMFSAQLEMLGVELPLAIAFWGVLANVLRNRWQRACLFAICAMLIKPTGVLAAVALATCLSIRTQALAIQKDFAEFKTLRIPLCTALCSAGVGGLLLWATRFSSIIGAPADPIPLKMQLLTALVAAPDITLLLASSLASGAIYLMRRTGTPAHDASTWLTRSAKIAVTDTGMICAMLLTTLLLVGIRRVALHPRYLVCIIPVAHFLLLSTSGQRRWHRIGLVGLLLFNVANQYGRLLPAIAQLGLGRNGSFLERSLEYRPYLQTDRQICHWLDRNLVDVPVLATWEIGTALRDPLYSYVGAGRITYRFVSDTGSTVYPFDNEAAALLRDRPPRLAVCGPLDFDPNAIGIGPFEAVFRAGDETTGLKISVVEIGGTDAQRVTVFARLLRWYLQEREARRGGVASDELVGLMRQFLQDWQLLEYGLAEGDQTPTN